MLDHLSPVQRRLVEEWLPGARVERDHGWGLVATTVLELTWAGSRFIVKAGGERDTHIRRELQAHEQWLGPWTRRGRAPELVHGAAEAKVLVTRYLPGELVLGSPAADDPDVYRQAGELLAALHGQPAVIDPDHEQRENVKALAWLDGPHRIAPETAARLHRRVGLLRRGHLVRGPRPPHDRRGPGARLRGRTGAGRASRTEQSGIRPARECPDVAVRRYRRARAEAGVGPRHATGAEDAATDAHPGDARCRPRLRRHRSPAHGRRRRAPRHGGPPDDR